ncbi:hypothetical protein [Lacihabitans soyangensis]|uniref:Uncharacterized protein n=1 Tax=Lacihabitans soyangensis TaxID=869394 RepID=A0AAE3H2W0_9BACT|nr:hypothetical protein [Lacihabitans soyangensis]MCP9762989.1 hypothetical protein [Lacihabitans soyangensis]
MAGFFEPKIVLDPFSLLFVSRIGVLKRVYCPFYVKCRNPVDSYILEQQVVVDMVKTEVLIGITYIIKGKSYHHSHFEILS